jgi:uncharacterized membrane protein YhaH (DUF805 family)
MYSRNLRNKEYGMNFGESITTCMGKYVTFSGRASRSEFWWFYLFTVLISWGATLVEAAMFGVGAMGILSGIASLVFVLPSLAASSRRLHDIGKSGWWLLIALTVVGIILLIVWWASDTKPAGDRFSEV